MIVKAIAIDPGVVTGVATWRVDKWDKPQTFEIPGGINGFAEWFDVRDYDQIYIEDWMVRPNTHKLTPQPDPYLIIGFVQGVCHNEGVPFVKIGPGEHKSFNGKGKQSKVRRIGWITETTTDGHAEDAASLLLSGLLRTDRDLVVPLLKEIG